MKTWLRAGLTIQLASGPQCIELRATGKRNWKRELEVTKDSQLTLHPLLAPMPRACSNPVPSRLLLSAGLVADRQGAGETAAASRHTPTCFTPGTERAGRLPGGS
jgi:hypothetical protein